MLLKVRFCGVEKRRVVVEQAQRGVAGRAQKRADNARLVVVIDGQVFQLPRLAIRVLFRLRANGAHAVLFSQHLLVPTGVHTK